MKTPTHFLKHCEGGTLLATVLLALVVSGTLISYLYLVNNEYRQVSRSQVWNKALMVSEAGVEEALAFINEYEGTGVPLYNWTSTAGANGWYQSGNVFVKTNTINANLGSYVVYVTNINNAPTIRSIGTANWNISSTHPLVRTVYVQTKFASLIDGSLVALSTINLNGNNIMVDSFDSRDPLHSDWQTTFTYQGSNFGYYPYLDPVGKRQAEAVVATDGSVINVGNAEIYGYADTAPGGTVDIKSKGSVGDLNWIGPDPSNPAKYGIQAGHARDDMNVAFPPVSLPPYTWAPLSTTSSNINGTTYTYVINQSGQYEIAGQLTANLYVAATNVTLYLPSGLKYSGSGVLTVGTNADLTIYSGDSIATSGSGSINNVNQISLALSILGLPSCTSISVGGNGTGTSYVYAPQASLSFNGSGGSTYDVVGAFFVHDIQLNGHFNFHYDKALLSRAPNRGFVPVSWKEIVGNN